MNLRSYDKKDKYRNGVQKHPSCFYLAEIDVRLHDGVEAALVDADDLHAQESGTEHGLGAAETLVADGHDLGRQSDQNAVNAYRLIIA